MHVGRWYLISVGRCMQLVSLSFETMQYLCHRDLLDLYKVIDIYLIRSLVMQISNLTWRLMLRRWHVRPLTFLRDESMLRNRVEIERLLQISMFYFKNITLRKSGLYFQMLEKQITELSQFRAIWIRYEHTYLSKL